MDRPHSVEEHEGTWHCATSRIGGILCPHVGVCSESNPIPWDEAMHIPPGCTYFCQPVDVGINKTLKNGMQEKWEDMVWQRSPQEV